MDSIMIKAKMICDFNNPISVAYSKIALKTWEAVKNVEVERFQCYTPATINDAPFKINWGKYSSAGKYKTNRHEITPTEKACLTSMFHWWKHIADTGEQVIILEHDAYVTNPKKLMALVDEIEGKDLWCVGIAMECVSMSPSFARYCMSKWQTVNEMIDAGPMAELFTAFTEWTAMLDRFDGKKEKIEVKKLSSKAKRARLLWPTIHSKNKLGMSNRWKEALDGRKGLQNAPVTQCFYPKVDSTIEHSKKLGSIYEPTTYRQLHILEKLYERGS